MPKYDSPPTRSFRPLDIHQAIIQHHVQFAPKAGDEWEARPTSPSAIFNPFFTGTPRTPVTQDACPIDRQEIIRKIKRREAPSPHPPKAPSPSPPDLQNDIHAFEDGHGQNDVGLEISRPRSALHRGDFREEQPPAQWTLDGQEHHPSLANHWNTPTSTSPVVPWHHNFPAAAFRPSYADRPSIQPVTAVLPARPRATSQASLSTSFTYQPPTSPLVHQANAADIPDHDAYSHRRRQQSPDNVGRRHTYSPRLLHQSKSALESLTTSRPTLQSHAASLRRESSFPYQAHQPRRSVGSFNSLPHTQFLGARRPSISDASPLQHAPMVGSYEESILRGRMSTTPSKPLDFVAQIGVLGKGPDCKPSLKCPSHVSIPFPAVFYSYPSGLAVDPEPSPYVGMIDLENSLSKPQRRDGSRRPPRQRDLASEYDAGAIPLDHGHADHSDPQARRRKHQKRKRRSDSPKEPPGGCYRIPQMGQLQIVLKNPNKTAVKLFLIPYDLSDMEPGQKTFIRQRSYSAGPIIDMPLNQRKNYGTDRPEAAIGPATLDPKDRPILRYLIHVHICCPAKGRYYLYQNIRVVFANRVPDGKEKLRSEIQLAEPRYSAWKPSKDCNNISSPAISVTDNAQRRRSAIFPTGSSTSASDMSHPSRSIISASVGSEPYHDQQQHLFVKSFDNQPYRFARTGTQHPPTLESRPGSRGVCDVMDTDTTNTSSQSHDPDDSHHSPPHSPLSTHSSFISSAPTTANLALGGDGDATVPTTQGLRISDPVGRLDSSTAHASPLTFVREQQRQRRGVAVSGMPPLPQTESLLSMRLRDLEMRGRDGDCDGDRGRQQ